MKNTLTKIQQEQLARVEKAYTEMLDEEYFHCITIAHDPAMLRRQESRLKLWRENRRLTIIGGIV